MAIRFVVLGDTKGKERGINRKVLIKILERINKLNLKPHFLVTLGDMVAGSYRDSELREQLTSFKRIINYQVNPPVVLPVVGNHEVNNEPFDESCEKIFNEILINFKQHGTLKDYNNTVYYMDTEECRFIVLNSYHFKETKRIIGSQLSWFSNAASVDKKFKIVFVHCPAYPTGAHIDTSLNTFQEDRDKFWKVIDENKIDIVFSGHEHNYSRRLIDEDFSTEKYKYHNQIYQVISGGGGEKLRDKFISKNKVIVEPKAKHHFVVVDIISNSIIIRAISIEGKTIDEFKITK